MQVYLSKMVQVEKLASQIDTILNILQLVA